MTYIVFNAELCTSETYYRSHPSKVADMYLLLTLAILVLGSSVELTLLTAARVTLQVAQLEFDS